MRKMQLGDFLRALVLFCFTWTSNGLTVSNPSQFIQPYKEAPLQNIVTWDEHSLFVKGERILFYSGEFHPFRLPVPGLWLDVFEKIKALGYNGVSFYVDWALLEGKRGTFRADGIFALDPFFKAAKETGIYLLARPGPYINAEVSGGGYPGWLQRVEGQLRTPAPSYLNATKLYVREVSKIISRAQITEGGPIILFQPENEYTYGATGVKFPNKKYFQYVENQYRNAGIVVPFISNDAAPLGHNAPGTGKGSVDIYGHDGYPLGFDCSNPTVWPDGSLPTNWRELHEEQSPTTPYSIIEFQGGSFDPWGGVGFRKCGELINSDFERVFYKNDFSFGVTIFNLYMTFGGTNFGNLGHPGGYSSYDYAAVISEDRQVSREKYSEAKLLANFLMSSPEYLTASPGRTSKRFTTSGDLVVTPLRGNGTDTKFYVLRHSIYNTYEPTAYKLNISTSQGKITVPRIKGHLKLNGRDSKIHVSDYMVNKQQLLYSTAEIFTHQTYESRSVLIVYGGPMERHELAFAHNLKHQVIEGPSEGLIIKDIDGSTTVNFMTSSKRRIVKFGKNLYVYIVDRESAYNYWVLRTPGLNGRPIVARAGYLLRRASITEGGTVLNLFGDKNSTTPLEILSGVPSSIRNKISTLNFNGKSLSFKINAHGIIKSKLTYAKPKIDIPDLHALKWKYHDSLPEITSSYSDSSWTDANKPKTENSYVDLETPTSLFSADYGYHAGSFLYRGHFTSTGSESNITLTTQGGSGFGMSCWVANTFLGSWTGTGSTESHESTFSIPKGTLKKGTNYVFTVLIDMMGYDENFDVGDSGMKNPRGILDYSLDSRPKKAIKWKMTGNLGGEDYADLTRGPLNEGGMYAERQGWHQPAPPSSKWKASSPIDIGINNPGIGFYSASFNLDIPQGYDVPLSFVFKNTTTGRARDYRVQLFVNGYQFGKYVNNIGPQTSFPVPEGILNHHGKNWVALTLWALDEKGAKLDGLKLEPQALIETGYGRVQLSPMPAWKKRVGAY